MKTKITILFCFTFLFFNVKQTQGQAPNNAQGGEFIYNQQQSSCLTEQQRQDVINYATSSYEQLKSTGRLAYQEGTRVPNPGFIWPVKKAASSNYNEVWAISNFVDQNAAFPNQLQDYNCGTRTYDTTSGYNHQGIDIFTWPFTWKLVDDDAAEIIAAADGQIIAKGDGQFDRNCDFNNDPWNAVYVQHNDGSIAWYGHMKNGSLTSKNVGDMVTQGEFLGVVGSSGNSTGPHLHFEVHTDNTYTQLVDPYAGACNSLNTESWWISQKPYLNPTINAVLTHSAVPNFESCPNTETTYESDQFTLSEAPYFAIYLKDQAAGTSVNLKTIRPNGTVQFEWNFDLTDDYLASWWFWSFQLDVEGEWTWQATYEGQTVSHTFNVGTLSADDFDFNSISVYPNPAKDNIYINSNAKVTKATLTDVLGKTIKTINSRLASITEVSTSDLTQGLYFLTLEGDANQKKTVRLIKQ